MRRIRHARFLLLARMESTSNLAQTRGRNVLVLCYGNIYRSPFVAAKLSSRLDNTDWKIRSAGFYNKVNRPCADEYIELARQFGVDLASHLSCRLNAEDIQWADLIVIMDAKNRDLLRDFGMGAEEKAIWIAAWLPGFRADVSDPFGKSAGQIAAIATRLFQAADGLAVRLEKISS
jgi:low molecular weight protein-tyrosine phosphatase